MIVRALASFAALAAFIVFAIGYLGTLGIRVAPPADRTNISMSVSDTNSLVIGSNVLLRGVPVGKVSGIEASSDSATIHFYVDGRFQIPEATDIRLDNLSALGESYIGLFPRSTGGATLRDGQHIASEKVIQPPSISQLIASLVRILQQLEPGPFQRVINEVDTGLPKTDAVLPNLSRASVLLRNTAAGMNGRGQEMLGDLQELLRDAQWVGPALASTAITMDSAADSLAPAIADVVTVAFKAMDYDPDIKSSTTGYGNPRVAIDMLYSFFGKIQKFLDEGGPDLKIIGQALLPHLQAVSGSLMNFDTGQMLDNILAAVPDDGAITLRVVIPKN